MSPTTSSPNVVIKLGYRTWRLLLTDTPDEGTVEYANHTVYIKPGRPPVEEMNTLIHELLHVVVHDRALMPGDLEEHEEKLVTGMANGLTELLLRNPVLRDILLHGANTDENQPTGVRHGTND